MANVGAAAAGKTLIGTGITGSPTFASIGTNSGLTANGVVIAEGSGAFQATSAGTLGQILMSNGAGVNPSFQSGGTLFGQTLTGDTGGSLSPTAGNWNIFSTATNGIDVTGSGSTLTVGMASPYADASFAFSRSASGATNTLTVANTSNTASSNALQQVSVGGTSAGDPFTTYTVTGTTNWSMGIDNSVGGDPFVIAASTALGTTNAVSINVGGAMSVTSNLTTMGDFDATRSSVGGLVNGAIQNTDNTNGASNAAMSVVTGGTSSGDPYFGLQISGSTAYSMGIDNSDSDRLKITSAFTGPSSGNTFVSIATTGEINFPLQSAFLAYLPSSDLNASGDNTNVVMGSITALTEIFDQNNDFVTTGTFTAPVTGRYFLQCEFFWSGGTVINGAQLLINTSNRNYRKDKDSATGISYVDGYATLADMDAGDTATFSSLTSDSGGKIDDLIGAATPFTWCSGYLVC